jgi:hypothetical protein
MQVPLKKGQAYRQLPNGEFVPLEENVKTAPIAADDLPPDLRPNETPVEPAAVSDTDTSKEAEKIIKDIKEKIDAGVEKIEERKKTNLSEQDRYSFLRAIVAGGSFKKEYSLFGGKMKVTFKTVSAAEAEAVTEAIVIQSGRVPYSNIVAMSAAHLKYSMACSIFEVTRETEEGVVIRRYDSPLKMYSDSPRADSYYKMENGILTLKEGVLHAVPGQKVIWAANDHFADTPIPVYNMLFKCFQQFDVLVAELAKEATEPNFFLDGVVGQ